VQLKNKLYLVKTLKMLPTFSVKAKWKFRPLTFSASSNRNVSTL